MNTRPANQLNILRKASTAWRAVAFLAVFLCAWTLVLLAHAPAAFADDKVPQDEYETSLEKSYVKLFDGTEATEEQVSSFISCLSDATYNDLSAETVQALSTGNLDYEVSDKDADIFLGGVEMCLKDTGLSKIVAGPETGDGDGGASNTETSGGETSGDSESPETSTEKSPSYLLPLATGLTLLAIIAFAVFLLVRGRSDDKTKGDEEKIED